MSIGTAEILPYGTWPSPLQAAQVAAASVKLVEPRLFEGRLYWLEGRPLEGGRQVVMERRADGLTRELLPAPFSARSRVHEYGGGCYTVVGGNLYFVNQADQQIYVMPLAGGAPHALTHAHGRRFADLCPAPGGYLIAVCEHHAGAAEPANSLVAVALHGGGLRLVASGADFYASPAVSAAGALCYLAWNHPHMPWDSAALWVSSSLFDSSHQRLAGGDGSAVFQPTFGPEGELFFVDDRSGFGNLYVARPDAYGEASSVCSAELEFGLPQWVFGQRTYAVLERDRLLVTYLDHGRGRSGLLSRSGDDNWQLQPFADELVEFSGVTAAEGQVYALAASETDGSHLVQLRDGLWQPLTAGEFSPLPPEAVSRAVPFQYDTPDGRGHAFFYAPQSANASAPTGTLPPFVTLCHGGPTGASSAAYSDRIQFWTSRGFAVIDVNYRGSTGFGRSYREALSGQWGVADAEDCASAARAAMARGWVSRRGAIRGSSAGGLTVLRALLDSDVFSAGVVLYGVLDLTRLVQDTHKFEQHYTDSLIAPWPEGRAVYEARSPAAAAERLRQPLLLFQGLEDKVVPPSQAQAFVAAASAAGASVSYQTYAGEGHGFRRAETLEDCLRRELEFYQQVLVKADN